MNTLFVILSLTGVLMMNGSLGDIFLRSLAFTKQQFFLRILQATVSILLILFASQWGVAAVAIAYLLGYFIVVFVKMFFISQKIKMGLQNVMLVIIKSYRIAIIYLPSYFLCIFILPNTIGCNIIKLIVFLLITIVTFLLLPNMVGLRYKKEMHNKVVIFVKEKMFRK